ncbi:MAG TPA: hypothetical protein VGC30_03775 [Dokdonella sp.]
MNRADLCSRALAGALPGFFVAAAAVGLAVRLAPGSWQAAIVPGLIAFAPAWIAAFGSAFLFAEARRAWLVLGAAAALGFALLHVVVACGWAS